MQNEARALVGAATRYIAGRNAVQTVYWRTKEGTETHPTRMVKVSKTFTFDKVDNEAPNHMKREQRIVY